MSMVTFRLYAAARAAAGADAAQVPAGPTSEVIAGLVASQPPQFATVLSVCSLLADGRRLDPQDDAPLADGTVIDVLPPFAGG